MKVFALFDERIASIQEFVILEANEKADGAVKTLARTKAGAGTAKSNDDDNDFYSLDDPSWALKRRALGVSSTPQPTLSSSSSLLADATAMVMAENRQRDPSIDPKTLVGIDSDM